MRTVSNAKDCMVAWSWDMTDRAMEVGSADMHCARLGIELMCTQLRQLQLTGYRTRTCSISGSGGECDDPRHAGIRKPAIFPLAYIMSKQIHDK